MPFPMIHLSIAYNILKNTTTIKKPCDFMLGAVAPDSVHFRDNYNSDMKKISHLCVGKEKWGRLSNNDEWQKNVLAFLEENKHTEKADFIYGFCAHILADIQNNIKIWTPFLKENIQALESGMGSIYHKESYDLDYALYDENPNKKIIWEMLEDAESYHIANIIDEDAINKMKDNLLHVQFLPRESVDVSCNKYATISRMQDFISEESIYIKSILFGND